jgi:DNA-binding CsgD family transcriptional regulator
MSLLYQHVEKPAKPPRYTVGQEIPDDEFIRNWTNYCWKEAHGHMAKGAASLNIDTEDLVQLGMLGLSRVPKNRRFSTIYVTNAIRRNMMKPWLVAQAQRKANKGIFSLSDPMNDDGNGSEWNNTLIDSRAQSDMDNVPATIDVARLREALTPVEDKIVGYILEGRDMDDIAAKMNCTRATVSNVYRQALRRMLKTSKKQSTHLMSNHGSQLGRMKSKKEVADEKEIRVLNWHAAGMTKSDIAKGLGISHQSVLYYMNRAAKNADQKRRWLARKAKRLRPS